MIRSVNKIGRAVLAQSISVHRVQSRPIMYGPLYKLAKKMLPKMSATERAALESGTVGFDRDIFSGNPQLTSLDNYSAELSQEEQRFMDNEVQQLCEMLDEYSVHRDQDLSPEAWDFIKKSGFLGMIIPQEYGGLGFSAHGHSQVVTKVSSRSICGGVSVSVPNSLGPAELLLRYGTDEQKGEFLPKLASGEHIPCFGLTGPSSGSDAANMRDTAVVVERDGQVGLLASFNKRYITLAPIATCAGIAVTVSDPDGLLGGIGSEGITVVLLERNFPGLKMGERHDPLSVAFMNGPVQAENIFIPLKHVIGGQERVGFGWNMLMDCLAEGRSISLPASAVAGSKVALNAVGGYSRVRKQFNSPIARMEGVQEHLARIASNTFINTSGQYLVNAMINKHEQPAVISGVCKQQITERGRANVIDAMDVLGGAGICKGPNNFMAALYASMPVAITVEGANTLTRSLIIYGQGLTRAHPHLFEMIKTIQDGNDESGFKREVNNLMVHGATNLGRSLTRATLRRRSKSDLLAYYESQFSRLASNFALCADMSLSIGGKLKFSEMVSGRFADIFSSLYLGYACMWFYKKNQSVEGLDKLFDYSMSMLCHDAQEAFDGVFRNFPMPGVGPAMRVLTFPYGLPYKHPSDSDTRTIADLISTNSAVRELMSEFLFISNNPEDRIRMINDALPLVEKADEILANLRKENREATSDEQGIVDQAEALREKIIQVDAFPALGTELHAPDDYVRPALRQYMANSQAGST